MTNEIFVSQLRQSHRERGRGGRAARVGRDAVFAILRGRGSAQEIGKVERDRAAEHQHVAASDELVPGETPGQPYAYPAAGAGPSQEEVSVLLLLIHPRNR